MKKIRIDFAAPSLQRTLFHTPPAAWLLAGLALGLCALAAAGGWRLLEAQRADAALAGAARARADASLRLRQAQAGVGAAHRPGAGERRQRRRAAAEPAVARTA
jgi:hypothetical protein